MERKLASIRKIIDKKPIPGADQIECVVIDGWQVVVRKDAQFKIDDEVIYIEIDSIVPAIPYFEFMKSRNYRVKTIKLKGQISQGLIIPVDDKYHIHNQINFHNKNFNNLDEYLGITKYISPDEIEVETTQSKKDNCVIKFLKRYSWYRKLTNKKSQGGFPEWISKTDEERVQNMSWIFDRYKDIAFSSTEKLDGQSATYWYKKGVFNDDFGICSRNIRKSIDDNSNWGIVAQKQNIKDKLKAAHKKYGNIVIQGEIVGPRIQGNPYRLKEKELYLFNVYRVDSKQYLTRLAMEFFAKEFGFELVPLIDSVYYIPETIDELVTYASGKSILNPLVNREGIVVRTPLKNISFKVISPDYLLKKED